MNPERHAFRSQNLQPLSPMQCFQLFIFFLLHLRESHICSMSSCVLRKILIHLDCLVNAKSHMPRANYEFLLGFSVLLIGSDLAPVWLVNMHDLQQEEGKRHVAVSVRAKGQNRKRGVGDTEGKKKTELAVCVFVCLGNPETDYLTRMRVGSCSIAYGT